MSISSAAIWIQRISYWPAICSFNPYSVFVPHLTSWESICMLTSWRCVMTKKNVRPHNRSLHLGGDADGGDCSDEQWNVSVTPKRFHLLDPRYNAARKHKPHSVCVLVPRFCSSRSSFHCGPQLVIYSVPVFKKEAIILISFKSVSNVSSRVLHTNTHTHTYSSWLLKSCFVMFFWVCFSSSSRTSIDAVFY